jgi:hypothetical protein
LAKVFLQLPGGEVEGLFWILKRGVGASDDEEVAVMVYLPFIRHLEFMNSISMFLLVLFDVPT